MRVDIWDVQAAKDAAREIDCGYARNFSDKFRIDYVIGKVIACHDIFFTVLPLVMAAYICNMLHSIMCIVLRVYQRH